MDVFIRFLSGSKSGRTEVCRIAPGARAWLGRTPKNDVQVPDQLVSGSHASILNEGGCLTIVDNASTNGLFQGGRRIERATVLPGARFVLGWGGPEVEVQFRVGDAARAGGGGAGLGGGAALGPSGTMIPSPVPLAAPPVALAAPPAPPPLAVRTPAPQPAPRMCPSCGRPLYEALACEACEKTVRRYPPPLAPATPPQASPSPAPQPAPPPAPPPPAPPPTPKPPAPAKPPAPKGPPPTPEERARRALEKEGLVQIEALPAPFGVMLFRCERAATRQPVAVKVLLRHPEGDSADETRFHREGRLASRLKHPAILSVHEVRAGLDYMLIVMEPLEGRTLLEEIRRDGRLPTARALSLAGKLARGLAHMHAQGIVHRNVCPENVRLAAGGEPKLADLALLRIAGCDREYADATVAGEMLGSLGHIAPEQIAFAAQVDARADVYALGATLFHAIAGRPPHDASERVGQRVGGLPPPPPRLEEAPDLVADIVERALAPHPADRFASAEEMAEAIEAAGRGLAVGEDTVV